MENTEAAPTGDNSTILGSVQEQTNTNQQPLTDPNAPPVRSFTELLNGDEFVDGWVDKLPGELREYGKTLSKFKTPVQLMASYASLEKEYSRKSNEAIKMPGDDATEEDWAQYAKRIGAPTKEQYDIKRPEGVPPELFNSGLLDSTIDVAAKYGIPKQAINELVNAYTTNLTQMAEEAKQYDVEEAQYALDTLKQEYGNNLTTQIQKASRAAAAVGLDVNDPAIGNNVSIIKALMRIDDLISEDNVQIPGVSQANTYEELYNKMLKSDDYMGKNGMKKQMEAQQKIQQLWEAMNR